MNIFCLRVVTQTDAYWPKNFEKNLISISKVFCFIEMKCNVNSDNTDLLNLATVLFQERKFYLTCYNVKVYLSLCHNTRYGIIMLFDSDVSVSCVTAVCNILKLSVLAMFISTCSYVSTDCTLSFFIFLKIITPVETNYNTN